MPPDPPSMICFMGPEVVHWRRNIFMIPSGKAGKSFVRELATLYQADASRNTWSHWETKHQTQGRLLESSIA